jgi:GNAT superfamily N-acetyltransferase
MVMRVELVAWSQDDSVFVFRVTEESMRAYVEEAFGTWDCDAQRRRPDESFDVASSSIVLVDGQRAGVLVVEYREAEVFLSRIFLLPAYQRKGVGTALMGRLINGAQAERKPLRLRVLRVNAEARRLYERLGFTVTYSTADHHYLELRPADI